MPIDLPRIPTYQNDRATVFETPTRLTSREALRKIREIGAISDNIVILTHCIKRAEQRSITRRQIERCIQKGVIEEGPFLNAHGNWQATVYRFAADERLTCVVAIDWPSKLIVITTYK